ncbi:MAG: sulfite exporter TauE/SafE family protein, partial [Sphaerochaetaceae bacterium]|nr:sulfite exporter TauE/SafE family protein [Sphaerochaetaceae bacterium]
MVLGALYSLAIGLSVGWTGIGGFLLLILFNDILCLSAGESLFLAFSMFLLEGLIGAISWKKKKVYKPSEVAVLSIGAFIGAIGGALVGKNLNEEVIKTVLYITVLVSGFSVFLRDILFKEKDMKTDISNFVLSLLGLLTAFVCSISGAGGPVLIIPLLI